MPIREVKDEIRILGWDDSPFDNNSSGTVPIVGSIVRGGKPYLDGVLVENVKLDGFDATEKIARATNRSRHKDQLRVILLDGITFAGFNTVDIAKLHADTGLPVVVATRKDIDFPNFKKAMKSLDGFDKRWKCVERAGELKKISIRGGNLYFQHKGIEEDKTRDLLRMSASKSITPEPIRISHLIASAITKGESVGGA